MNYFYFHFFIFSFLICFIIIILLDKMKTKIIKKGIKSHKKNGNKNGNKNKYNFKSKINKKSKKYIKQKKFNGGAVAVVNPSEERKTGYTERFTGPLKSAVKSAASYVVGSLGPIRQNYYIYIYNEINKGKYENYEEVIKTIMSKETGFNIIPLIIDTKNRTLNTNLSNYENENCFLHYQKNRNKPLLNLHKLLLSFRLTPNIKEYVNVSKFSDYLEYLPLLDLIINFEGNPNKFAKFVERFKENIKDDITFEDFDFILSIFITFFFEKQEVSEGQISIIGLINHVLQIIKIINIYKKQPNLYNEIIKLRKDPAILWLYTNAGLFYTALAYTPDTLYTFTNNIVTPITGIYEKLKDIMEFEAFKNNPIDISHYVKFTLKKYLNDFKVKNGFSFINFGYIEDLLNNSLDESGSMNGGSRQPSTGKGEITRKTGLFSKKEKYYNAETGNGNQTNENNEQFYNASNDITNKSEDEEEEYFDSSEINIEDYSQISIPNLKSITDMKSMFSDTTNWSNYNQLLNLDKNRINHTIYDIIENKNNKYLVLSRIISTITFKSGSLSTQSGSLSSEFNDVMKLFNQLYILIYGRTCKIPDTCTTSRTTTNSNTNSRTSSNSNTSSISSNKPFKEKIKLFKKKILSSFGSLFFKYVRSDSTNSERDAGDVRRNRLMVFETNKRYIPNISLERIINLIGGIGIKTLCKSLQDNCRLINDGYSKFDKKLGDLFTLNIRFKKSPNFIDKKTDILVKNQAALNLRLLFIYTIMTININRLIIKKIEENIHETPISPTATDGIAINPADLEFINSLCSTIGENCKRFYILYRSNLETWINNWYNSYGKEISLIGLITSEDLKYLIQYCLPVSSNILEEFLGLRINSDNLIVCSETELI